MDEQPTPTEVAPSVDELMGRITRLEESEAKLKAESRKWEDRSKGNYAKLMEFERAQMTDTEKVQADQDRAVAEAAEAARRAVLGEVGIQLAAAEFKTAAAQAGLDGAEDLLDLVDVSKFLGEDGLPNSGAISERVSALASMWAKPAFDQNLGIGPQGSGSVGQLTREALFRMTHREIAQARKDGRLDALMRGEV